MREKNIFLRIVEKFEEGADRYRVASQEYLASMKDFKDERKETKNSQVFMERMLLTLAGSKGNLSDDYNGSGTDVQCLVPTSKAECLKILRNEFNENRNR